MSGRTLMLVLFLVALAFTARADGPGNPIGATEGLRNGLGGQNGIGGLGGGGAPPASCSNSLDFTKACNSQYAGAIL